MSPKSVPLLILMVAGICATLVDRSIDDSINSINDERRREAKDVDTDVNQDLNATPAVTNAITSPTGGPSTTKPGILSWFLAPLTQNVQFLPQSFLQNRIGQLKETLSSLGSQGRDDVKGKQLGSVNGLLQLVGANDPGFYTNRLEPAGFFGGNGWLANKGGILGNPGAILSTGSILTDYPTPYRKK